MSSFEQFLLPLVAALATLASIFALIPLAKRIGLIDQPGYRRAHVLPTPMVGGLAMIVGAAIALVIVPADIPYWLGLAIGVVVLGLVGAQDDRKGLSPITKLLGQVAAAVCMVGISGFQIDSLGDLLGLGRLDLGLFAKPFTVFAVVTAINAINMIDGVDGLAGAIVLATLVMLLGSAISVGASGVATLILVTAGAVAGFLLCNARLGFRSRALIFMGDAGSMVLGFVLAWIVILLGQLPWSAYSPVVALWLLGVPLADGLSLAISRVSNGYSPLSPDANHFHHVLMRRGVSVVGVGFSITTLHVAVAGLALILDRRGVSEHILFFGFLCWLVAFHLVKTRLVSHANA